MIDVMNKHSVVLNNESRNITRGLKKNELTLDNFCTDFRKKRQDYHEAFYNIEMLKE